MAGTSYARLDGDDGLAELLDAAPWSDRGPTSGERVHVPWKEADFCSARSSPRRSVRSAGTTPPTRRSWATSSRPSRSSSSSRRARCSIRAGSILLPPESERVEHEAELGVVIGRRARNVRKEDALAYVFGYTCVGDITARDLQKKDGQWARAKGFDTFCPVGPWIETELDPRALAVRAA